MTQAPDERDDPEVLAEPDSPPGPETLDQPGSPDEPEALAQLGGLAEPEAPRHTVDPDAASDDPVEDSVAYELAVEDGAALAPDGRGDPGAGDRAPAFRAPGEG